MTKCFEQKISCVSVCLNAKYLPNDRHFYFKSEDLDCILRGPWPIIYIKHPIQLYNLQEYVIQILIHMYHFGLINFPIVFKYNHEFLCRWLKENLNQIVKISDITIQFAYHDFKNNLPNMSPSKTNYMRNNAPWSQYNAGNYMYYKDRKNCDVLIQEFHIDTHYCSRFLEDISILDRTPVELINYFSGFISKSWRRHSNENFLPLPYELMRTGRIKHSELPKKKSLSVSKKLHF